MPDEIEFTLNGARLSLSRDKVEQSLADVVPAPIRKHAVSIGDVWFPVRQAFGVATGLDRTEFTSHTARRHLAPSASRSRVRSRLGAVSLAPHPPARARSQGRSTSTSHGTQRRTCRRRS